MRKVKAKSYQYIENLSKNESSQKLFARQKSEELGLEAISLSKTEAQIMQFFLSDIKAQKVVEIGTLTGLSALYILEELAPQGKLWTLEKSPEHAAKATEVLQDYIQKNQCEILVGDARETLVQLKEKAPFDAVFIDGNKAAYLDYFNWAIENTRVGALIFVDNIFLAGAVWGEITTQKFNDKQIRVVNEVNQIALNNPHLKASIIPTEEGLLVCKKLS